MYQELVIDKSFGVVTCKKDGNLEWTLAHLWEFFFLMIAALMQFSKNM